VHSSASPGLIQFKTNALEDADIAAALYRASQTGVKVDLLVRDTCRLRPGLPGISENIRVVSVIGRFLEHGRIYYFRNGGDEEYFIGSADCMKRNLESRVEAVIPIEDPLCRKELRTVLDAQLSGDHGEWEMQPTAAICGVHPTCLQDQSAVAHRGRGEATARSGTAPEAAPQRAGAPRGEGGAMSLLSLGLLQSEWEMKRAEGAEMLAVEGQAKCRTAPRRGTTRGPVPTAGATPRARSAAPPGLRTSAWPHLHHEPRRGGTPEPGCSPGLSRLGSCRSRPGLCHLPRSPHTLWRRPLSLDGMEGAAESDPTASFWASGSNTAGRTRGSMDVQTHSPLDAASQNPVAALARGIKEQQ